MNLKCFQINSLTDFSVTQRLAFNIADKEKHNGNMKIFIFGVDVITCKKCMRLDDINFCEYYLFE